MHWIIGEVVLKTSVCWNIHDVIRTVLKEEDSQHHEGYTAVGKLMGKHLQLSKGEWISEIFHKCRPTGEENS